MTNLFLACNAKSWREVHELLMILNSSRLLLVLHYSFKTLDITCCVIPRTPTLM